MVDFTSRLFSMSTLIQVLLILISLGASYILSRAWTKVSRLGRTGSINFGKITKAIDVLLLPFLWCFLQWTFVAASKEFEFNFFISRSAAVFITALLASRVVWTFNIQQGFKKTIATSFFSLALLEVSGLLPHLLGIMDNIGFRIGDLHLTLLSVFKGGLTFWLLIWIATLVSRRLEKELKSSIHIEPSLQALFFKLIRVTLVSFSVLVALSSVGLDLSAFAVFGGAIGVGIGFGLQKMVSNLICGIVLLLDRSIKPGDVIALNQGTVYGEVIHLGARCVSIRTRSGKEHLIPNEEFITHKSENWSHHDRLLRISLPIRAALNSNVPLVMDLLLQSLRGVDRVLENPQPGVRLKGFSDSAIEFELRVWINDPQRGMSKVKSDTYLNIWKLFQEHNIIIPHQQQDIHLKEMIQHNYSEAINPMSQYVTNPDQPISLKKGPR